MKNHQTLFDEQKSLEHLYHYLPAQAALKDFVHHNTLHAFQEDEFFDALRESSAIFGYKTYLSLSEFRNLYAQNKIRENILDKSIRIYITDHFAGLLNHDELFDEWKSLLFNFQPQGEVIPRVGRLRQLWKKNHKVNLDKMVQPYLFRILAAYLDQGIAIWKFPEINDGFLPALQHIEKNGWVSLFKNKLPASYLLKPIGLSELLKIIVGSEEWYEQYLFDQQFSHPGWSGMVCQVDKHPEILLDKRKISLHELIYFELLLELDALISKLGHNFSPLIGTKEQISVDAIFAPVPYDKTTAILSIWQNAYEWSFYDDVLSAIKQTELPKKQKKISFQGVFCIDDREYSFRRHIEATDVNCETYGTPGFFGVEFYFQPENGKFHTKACPAPMNPAFLIKEANRKRKHKKEPVISKLTHGLFPGWIISQTLGFWTAFKLFINIFRPSVTPFSAVSFHHMDKVSTLSIKHEGKFQDGLQVGYTFAQMIERVENTLRSIGFTDNFAQLVYIVGHGASSVNNPYYAGYDCGACAGRPGAVNARVFAHIANKPEVRIGLSERGIHIPDTTRFVGAMHDTTRDEIKFFDLDKISTEQKELHKSNLAVFEDALIKNAKERAVRFEDVITDWSSAKIHNKIKKRSISLFEPRPEWNHTDNALCLVGRKEMYQHVYLDKRPFINNYDYKQDPSGFYLGKILGAAIPVCGGINLEYYFSRVDQQRFGAGTKLPHNVVGLFGVSNGVDSDLRPGLPSQMIEIHEPLRILFLIEQLPDVVLATLKANHAVYQWVINEWVNLVVKEPETSRFWLFKKGSFIIYHPSGSGLLEPENIEEFIHQSTYPVPVLLNK